MIAAKPFEISKQSIWRAWESVKRNHGSHGVDLETIENFEANLKDNLYKLWNRMSSGSYFPPPVRKVEIPKKDGGVRALGIPTVADRIAQKAVKDLLEPILDPIFHTDSYGYRPNKSAVEAVGTAKERCWKFKWVIDFDIKGFFDNMSHELLMKALRRHTNNQWVLLYIERWLLVPMESVDGEQGKRTKGTPQGGVISPLLANLFMHYAFDKWMEINFPRISFERYADDIVIHCVTEKQSKHILECVKKRLLQCHLELHPEKTKIVYCGRNRELECEFRSFNFLGFTFQSRAANTKDGKTITGFLPAISKKSEVNIRDCIRNWKLKHWTQSDIREIAEKVNPVIRGWLNYYCVYYGSKALQIIAKAVNSHLIKWAKRKFKKNRNSYNKACEMIKRLHQSVPNIISTLGPLQNCHL